MRHFIMTEPRSSVVRIATPSAPCSSEHGLWKFWFGYIKSLEIGDHDETVKKRRSFMQNNSVGVGEALTRR